MDKRIDRLTLLGQEWTNVRLDELFYGDGSVAVRLTVDEDGFEETLANISVNLGAYDLRPEPGAFFVKDYGESEGLLDALVEAGVLEKTGRTVTFGPFNTTAQEARVL